MSSNAALATGEILFEVLRDGRVEGPYSHEQLQSLHAAFQLGGDTLLRVQGQVTWTPVHKFLGPQKVAAVPAAPGSVAGQLPHPHAPIASLVAGVVGFVAWIIPIFGLPITIIGLVQCIKARKGPRPTMALFGIILCSIGLFVALSNAIIGAYMGATGQHALVNQILGRNSR